MIKFLKSLFSTAPEPDYSTLVREGAVILDVRSAREYAAGHIKGSVNVPVDMIGNGHKSLSNKKQTVITCCASGMRSGAAAKMLRANGFEQVHNGGPWHTLQRKIWRRYRKLQCSLCCISKNKLGKIRQ